VYSHILRYQISVAIQYSRDSFTRFCRDVAKVDKWSVKAEEIQDFEKKTRDVLGELNNVKLNNVDQRIMELQKDTRRGFEVWTFVL
jgi:hypothetical protein